jgi:hypothetical protein
MPSFSRRRFALGAAAATAGALIAPADIAFAQAAQPDTKSALDVAAQAAMAKLSPAAQAEVEMKVASVMRKYGDRLSAEQRADVRKALAEVQDGLEKMRAFALDNGDQPATIFHAYRSEGKR